MPLWVGHMYSSTLCPWEGMGRDLRHSIWGLQISSCCLWTSSPNILLPAEINRSPWQVTYMALIRTDQFTVLFIMSTLSYPRFILHEATSLRTSPWHSPDFPATRSLWSKIGSKRGTCFANLSWDFFVRSAIPQRCVGSVLSGTGWVTHLEAVCHHTSKPYPLISVIKLKFHTQLSSIVCLSTASKHRSRMKNAELSGTFRRIRMNI